MNISRSADSRHQNSHLTKSNEVLSQYNSAIKGEDACYQGETSCSKEKKSAHRYQPVRITQACNSLIKNGGSSQKKFASLQKLPIRNLHKLLASPKRNIRRRLDKVYDPPPMYKNVNRPVTNIQKNDKNAQKKITAGIKSVEVKKLANCINQNGQYNRKSCLPANAMKNMGRDIENRQSSNEIVFNKNVASNKSIGLRKSVNSRKSYIPVKTTGTSSRYTVCSIVPQTHLETVSIINDGQEKNFKELGVVEEASIDVNNQGESIDGTSTQVTDEGVQTNVISPQVFIQENKNSLLHLESINNEHASPSNLIPLDRYMCTSQLENHNCSVEDIKLNNRNNDNCGTTSTVTELQEPSAIIGIQSPVTLMDFTEMPQIPTVYVTEATDILKFNTVKLTESPHTSMKNTDTSLSLTNNVCNTENTDQILHTNQSDAVNLSNFNNELKSTNLKHLLRETNSEINENKRDLTNLESNLKSSICVHEQELSRLKLLLSLVQNMLHLNKTKILGNSSEGREQSSVQQIEWPSKSEMKNFGSPAKTGLASKIIQSDTLISENTMEQKIQDKISENINFKISDRTEVQSKIRNIEKTNAKEDMNSEEEKENFKTPNKYSKINKINKINSVNKSQSRRRSARLAAKLIQSPQIAEDSFVNLEKTLNIAFPQSQPSIPFSLRTPRREIKCKTGSGKMNGRPLKEYMNLKSTIHFLETPDTTRFRRRLTECDTPLHSRTINSFLSNQLLTQLVDLHADSPDE